MEEYYGRMLDQRHQLPTELHDQHYNQSHPRYVRKENLPEPNLKACRRRIFCIENNSAATQLHGIQWEAITAKRRRPPQPAEKSHSRHRNIVYVNADTKSQCEWGTKREDGCRSRRLELSTTPMVTLEVAKWELSTSTERSFSGATYKRWDFRISQE